MMLNIIWYVNGVEMPTPSGLKYSFEDVDNDSYRSVINANLIRDIIASEFVKLYFTYRYLTPSQAQLIRNAIKVKKEFVVRAKSPILGENEFVEFKAYCSKMDFEMLEMQVGYSASFNVIQTRK